jgi:CheW-like domain
MLLLLFQVGTWRYAIDARQVIGVVSPVTMRRSEQAGQLGQWGQQSVVGFFQQVAGATMVSVIDLSQLLLGNPSPRNFGTRVMLVRDSDDRVWGLMATAMVETLTIAPKLWDEAEQLQGMNSSNPYVRQMLMWEQALIHGLAIDRVFSQVQRYENDRVGDRVGDRVDNRANEFAATQTKSAFAD